MKTKMSIFSIATAMMLSVASCSIESIDGAARPENNNVAPAPTGDVATIYTTTGSGTNQLTKSAAKIFTTTNMAPSTILVDPTQQFQAIDGFGFAITYSTCYNLLNNNRLHI